MCIGLDILCVHNNKFNMLKNCAPTTRPATFNLYSWCYWIVTNRSHFTVQQFNRLHFYVVPFKCSFFRQFFSSTVLLFVADRCCFCSFRSLKIILLSIIWFIVDYASYTHARIICALNVRKNRIKRFCSAHNIFLKIMFIPAHLQRTLSVKMNFSCFQYLPFFAVLPLLLLLQLSFAFQFIFCSFNRLAAIGTTTGANVFTIALQKTHFTQCAREYLLFQKETKRNNNPALDLVVWRHCLSICSTKNRKKNFFISFVCNVVLRCLVLVVQFSVVIM